MPPEWEVLMLRQLSEWEQEEVSSEVELSAKLQVELEEIGAQLRRLDDLHVDGEIERSDYAERKRKLVHHKLAKEAESEKIAHQGVRSWLEPLRALINAVQERNLPTAAGDLTELRDFVAEVASNLSLNTLNSRKVLWDWNLPYALIASRGSSSGWSG